jgi:hypothetical protein
VILHFVGAHVSLQVLWREFMDKLKTIQVWGKHPFKHHFYNFLHNHTNLEAWKALFEQLASEVDGDCVFLFGLGAAKATKAQSNARVVLVKELSLAKHLSSLLSFDQQLIQPLSKVC